TSITQSKNSDSTTYIGSTKVANEFDLSTASEQDITNVVEIEDSVLEEQFDEIAYNKSTSIDTNDNSYNKPIPNPSSFEHTVVDTPEINTDTNDIEDNTPIEITESEPWEDSIYEYQDETISVDFGDKNNENENKVALHIQPDTSQDDEIFSQISDWIDGITNPDLKQIEFALVSSYDSRYESEPEINLPFSDFESSFWNQIKHLFTRISNSNSQNILLASENGQDIIINQNVLKNINVKYQILPNKGIKEEIVIIDNRDAQDAFIFTLKLQNGISYHKNTNHVIDQPDDTYYFTDSNDNYLAHFLPLIATDQIGSRTENISMQITPLSYSTNEHLIKLYVDPEWLYSPDRVFPIFIDPSIIQDSHPGAPPTYTGCTWTNGNSNNLWNNSGNWAGCSGNIPGIGVGINQNAIFDGATSSANATIDASVNLTSISIESDYNGTISAGNQTINISGDWNNESGAFDASTSTIVFEPTTDVTVTLGSDNFYNLILNGTNATWQLNDPLTVSNDLTINNNNTLDLNGENLLLSASSTLINNGTLKLLGNETLANVTNDIDSGTIEYNGSGTYSQLIIGNIYHNLLFSGTGNWTLNNTLTVNGILTINSGSNLAQGTYDITTKNNTTLADNTFTHGTGKFKLEGDLGFNAGNNTIGDVIIGASPDTTTLESDLSVVSLVINSNDILITDGYELDISNTATINSLGEIDATSGTDGDSTIYLGLDWENSGTFTPGNSTLVLNGTNQSISGVSTFNNLTKIESNNNSINEYLTIEADTTQVVKGTLTLNGRDTDDMIYFQTDTPGSQAEISMFGASSSVSADFLNIQDQIISIAGGSSVTIPISPSNSEDQGNNNGWFGFAPLTVDKNSNVTATVPSSFTFTINPVGSGSVNGATITTSTTTGTATSFGIFSSSDDRV
ncbi:MAG: hypothetical protein DRI46_13935, partial [Chloroflexi bacterium]